MKKILLIALVAFGLGGCEYAKQIKELQSEVTKLKSQSVAESNKVSAEFSKTSGNIEKANANIEKANAKITLIESVVPEVSIAVASAENKKAKKVGFEWRDTGKMIKKAEKLNAKGKSKDSIALAKKAKEQALNAQQQAKDQANAGPNF